MPGALLWPLPRCKKVVILLEMGAGGRDRTGSKQEAVERNDVFHRVRSVRCSPPRLTRSSTLGLSSLGLGHGRHSSDNEGALLSLLWVCHVSTTIRAEWPKPSADSRVDSPGLELASCWKIGAGDRGRTGNQHEKGHSYRRGTTVRRTL
jgi:hypothetical protein